MSDDKNQEYQVYLDERKELIHALREGSLSFDKAILTLAAGAFGLSLTFIFKFFPDKPLNELWRLYWAWGSLGGSITLTLSSFLTSQKACEKQIENLEKPLLGKGESPQNGYSLITKALNILSIVAFISGLFLLTSFGCYNLINKGDAMGKKLTNGFSPAKAPIKLPSKPLTEGYVPPPPPKKPITPPSPKK